MGRNVAAAADALVTPPRGGVTFVCAIGGSLRAGEYRNPDHVCRKLAARSGGESGTLCAPALVINAVLRDDLYRNETIKLTLDRARRALIALIGIGDPSEDSNMVRMGWFSPQGIAEARLGGTIGGTMGHDFIDIHGKPAIASEDIKAPAILGALRTKATNTLATSYTNIHTILRLDEATKLAPGDV